MSIKELFPLPIRQQNSPWYRYVVLVSVPLLLWLAVKDLSLTKAVNALSKIRFVNIIILLAVNSIVVCTMTARWWMILVTLGYKIPYRLLMGYRLAGNAVGYFTPGPQFGGEPVQVYLLHRMQLQRGQRVPVEVASASVAMDRLMELVANFTVLIIGSLFMVRMHTFDTFFDKGALLFAGILLGFPVGLLWAVCSGKRPFTRLLRKIEKMYTSKVQNTPQRWKKIVHAIPAVELQVESLCLRKPGILIQAGFFSLLNWTGILSEFWLTFWCLGVTLTGIQLIITITAARFAFLTPLPGGIGALEASLVFILESLGFNPALGVSVCVIIRIRDLIVGCAGLWLTSIFMASVQRGT